MTSHSSVRKLLLLCAVLTAAKDIERFHIAELTFKVTQGH